MRIGFIHLLGVWPCHIAVEMELIEKHAKKGDAVHLFSCRGGLLSCQQNIDHHYFTCGDCLRQRALAMAKVEAKYAAFPFPVLTRAERCRLWKLPFRFQSMDELRGFKYENFDVGEAVISSMVSRYRNPHQDPVFDVNLVRRLMISAVGIYLTMRRELKARDIRLMYVFNGRYATHRAVLRACQAEKVECLVHDRGFDKDHYHLYQNQMIHEIAPRVQEIREYWDAAEPNRREQIASQFFNNRRAGLIPNWKSYTKEQQKALLPAGWNPDGRNVAIYVSSEDEFVAIGPDWKNDLYPEGQAAAIRKIAQDMVRLDPAVHLWVRVHPNLKGVDNPFTRDLAKIGGANVTVIPADSPVDTYALLDACEKVVTFGSTMGIEAVFWGKPSVLLGKSFYRLLNACTVPVSHAEAVQAICSMLPRPDRRGALQYGCYEGSFGTPYSVYQAQDPFTGEYRGLFLGREFFEATRRRIRKMSSWRQRWWLWRAKYALTNRIWWA